VLVCLIYFLTNIAYLGILSPTEIMFAKQDRIGSAALEVAIGPIGALIMAIMIMVSTFGCNNGVILPGGRLFEAMANDSLFFKIASKQNNAGVPKYSLIIQCIWACLLCFSGSYNQLLDYTVFAILIFYFLTVLILFNKKVYKNELSKGQQLLFLVYLMILFAIAGNLLIAKPTTSVVGLLIVLSGIPIFYLFKKTIK
jgi:APA family basic amino acid/polyamine antiporter